MAARNANHPKKGSSTKVEPIKDMRAIRRIKAALAGKPRDLCLFSLGINTAYRANELLSLRVDQVAHLKAGDALDLKQRKTKKHRAAVLNHSAIEAIGAWLRSHPDPQDNAPLFLSQKGGALTVSTMTNMVKGWCEAIEIKGNFGSHTLRKTWGYQQLRQNRTIKPHMVMPLLMEAYGHTSQKQTLDYLCIQSDEITGLFMQVEL